MKRQYNKTSTNHMCISVEGVLNQYKRKAITFCNNDDGTPMHPVDAKQVFKDAYKEGKRVLPMGDCYRFDYQKGCKGHIKSLKPTEWRMAEIEKEQIDYIIKKLNQ